MSGVGIGIDPGKQGGICAYDGLGTDFYPMPLQPCGRVDAMALLSVIKGCAAIGSPCLVLVEDVNSFGMGRQSAFVFGQNLGAILSTLEIIGVPWDLIKPRKWQTTGPGNAAKGKDQKAITVDWAMRRFPLVKWPGAKAKREQIADAIGIAYAAYAEVSR